MRKQVQIGEVKLGILNSNWFPIVLYSDTEENVVDIEIQDYTGGRFIGEQVRLNFDTKDLDEIISMFKSLKGGKK